MEVSWKCHLINLAVFLPSNHHTGDGSPSKNPYIKTPLVVSFLLGVVFSFFATSGVLMSKVLRRTPIIIRFRLDFYQYSSLDSFS